MYKLFLLLIILLIIPFTLAEEEDCGITHLATCIPQKLVEFIITIFNAPLESLLHNIQNFLTEPVRIEQFKGLWQIVMYVLSLFYGLFLLFAGYTFMISGYDAVKRETAKEWLKNIIFMIIFVQASYFLYEAILEIGASLTTGVFRLIDPSFFLLRADSIPSVGLQLVFSVFYILTLFITLIFLFMRYFLVSLGVVLFPLGLFLYFIPPLKAYGRLIIEGILILIFLPFIHSLILLVGSKLLELPSVENLKILVMIGTFTLVNLSMILLILFSAFKAVNYVGGIGSSVSKTAKYFTG